MRNSARRSVACEKVVADVGANIARLYVSTGRTSPNAVKSQLFIALIAYLLLELLRRIKTKGKAAFSNFVEKIRICLCYYLTLDYVIQRIQPKAHRIRAKQKSMNFDEELTFF